MAEETSATQASTQVTTATTNNQPTVNENIGLTIKPFSGEKASNASQWLRIFERHSKINGWSDARAVEVAVLYLYGPAEIWCSEQLDREKIRPDATWAQWKEAFTKRFVNVETTGEVIDQLLEVQQGKYESVEDYGTRVQDLVRKVGTGLPANVVLGVYKKGLHSNYRLELEMIECKTLAEAIEVVAKKEKFKRLEKKAQMEERSGPKDYIEKLTDKMEKMRLRLMNAETAARKSNACFLCFEVGHAAHDCPNRAGRKNSKKNDEKTNGELRRVDATTTCQEKKLKEFIELEVDCDELNDYLDVDKDEEIRVVEKRPYQEDNEESGSEAKKLKLRIPTDLIKKKQAMDEARKELDKMIVMRNEI